MNEKRRIYEIVESILYTDESTRNNDDRLYLAVCNQIACEKGINLERVAVPSFLLHRKANGFPDFETVTRYRRKAQEKDENLRSNDTVYRFRAEREMEFREWAKKN